MRTVSPTLSLFIGCLSYFCLPIIFCVVFLYLGKSPSYEDNLTATEVRTEIPTSLPSTLGYTCASPVKGTVGACISVMSNGKEEFGA